MTLWLNSIDSQTDQSCHEGNGHCSRNKTDEASVTDFQHLATPSPVEDVDIIGTSDLHKKYVCVFFYKGFSSIKSKIDGQSAIGV